MHGSEIWWEVADAEGAGSHGERARQVDADAYLGEVEAALRSDGVVLVQLSEDFRKPMLRSLLGMSKREADARRQEVAAELGFVRLRAFFLELLLPLMDADDAEQAVFGAHAREIAQSSEPSKGAKAWGALAKGRRHQGQLPSLVVALAPQLLPQLSTASTTPSADEVFEAQVSEQRKTAARRLLTTVMPTTSAPPLLEQLNPQSLGQRCERECAAFLRWRHGGATVLENVYVKQSATSRRTMQVRAAACCTRRRALGRGRAPSSTRSCWRRMSTAHGPFGRRSSCCRRARWPTRRVRSWRR